MFATQLRSICRCAATLRHLVIRGTALLALLDAGAAAAKPSLPPEERAEPAVQAATRLAKKAESAVTPQTERTAAAVRTVPPCRPVATPPGFAALIRYVESGAPRPLSACDALSKAAERLAAEPTVPARTDERAPTGRATKQGPLLLVPRIRDGRLIDREEQTSAPSAAPLPPPTR